MLRKSSIAIGGGKGGVGKSTFAANLAVIFGQLNIRTLLVDADFDGANLHSLCGVDKIPHTLGDFICGATPSLDSVLIPFEHNCSLLSSAADILSILKPTYRRREKLLSALNRCDSDLVVVDLPSGTGNQCLDFFLAAGHRIIVVEPDPLSFENGYLFLKSAIFRKLLRMFHRDGYLKNIVKAKLEPSGISAPSIPSIIQELKAHKPSAVEELDRVIFSRPFYLVINKADKNSKHGVTDVFRSVIAKNLGIDIPLLTSIDVDPLVRKSLLSRTPLAIDSPESAFACSVRNSIDTLMKLAGKGTFPKLNSAVSAAATPTP